MAEENKKRKFRLFSAKDAPKGEVNEDGLQYASVKEYPFFIERRLKGYNAAAALAVMFGGAGWFVSGSVFSMLLGLLISLSMFGLGFVQKRRIDRIGYDNWRFEVIEHTYLTPIGRALSQSRPTGFYAEAKTGDYKGKMCHIVLTARTPCPPEGRFIDLCVPKDMNAGMIRDVVYIPQYYGISLVGED